MTKQTEALSVEDTLKLALDEFKNQRAGLEEVGITDHSLDELIKALEEALAKQEQKGNQLSCYCPNCEILGRELARIEKQDQGEPVAHTAIFHCPNCEYPHRQVTHITGTAQPPWSPQRKEQGPVAWMMHNSSGDEISITESNLRHHQPAFVQDLWKDSTPLYTTPQQRKPLTDEHIKKVWGIHDDDDDPTNIVYERDITRAIETAHGIKENT